MGFLLGSGPRVNARSAPRVTGLRVQTSANGMAVPLVYGQTRVAGNMIWYGDFVAIAHNNNQGGGGKGGGGGGGGKGGGSGSVSYTYQVAVALGLCEGPVSGVVNAWSGKSKSSPEALNLAVFAGNAGQAPWGYLATNHSDQVLDYGGLAYVAAGPFDLGTSQQMPNLNFEVVGPFAGGAIPGQPDADPATVLQDFLANAVYGAGFPAGRIGNLATYSSYCRAAGLIVSPAFTEQRAAAEYLKDLLEATNSEAVWSAGQLALAPYGDQAISANGAAYSPPTAPLYSLGDDDFLDPGASEDPILLARARPADQVNAVKVEYLDRALDYNPNIAEAKDDAAIESFGLRPGNTKQTHFFALGSAARLSAQLMLQRQQVRNQYQFYLGWKYILLDPMDIVAISDSALGLNAQWVRIKEIEEDDQGRLKVTAEEYLAGTGSAPLYGTQPNQGYAVNYNSDPGNVNNPIIFDAPTAIATSGLEVWCAVSGGRNWGGCDIWASSDGNTYRLIGRLQGTSRMGALAAALPSAADPDTADALAVDLTMSAGTLLSGTQADADSYHTLCYADGELIAYQTAQLTAAYKYSLAYLRRGAYGTTIGAHEIGSAFVRLDNALVKIPYSKDQIGQTLYLKFVSFNIYGGGGQSLADATAYSHAIQGPPPPADVAGFTAQQQGGVVAFAWNPVDTGSAYDIRYGPQGTTGWNDMLPLTEAMRGSEMTNASVPPGTWTFAIRARNVADLLSPQMATVGMVVTNPNPIVAQVPQAPNWFGTLHGFIRHVSGVLMPQSTKAIAQYPILAAPPAAALASASGGALAAATYYVKISYATAAGETLPSPEGSLAVAAGNLLIVNAPAAVAGAAGWNVYVGIAAGIETKQNPSPLALGNNWTLPTGGIVVGGPLPGVNTTGFDWLNTFVPDTVANPYYEAPLVDTGFTDTLRVWAGASASLGPGVGGNPAVTFEIDTWQDGQSDPAAFQPWTVGQVAMRYLRARVYAAFASAGQDVCFIESFTPTADRSPKIEQNAQNLSVMAGGTAIAFPSPYHSPPNVTLTVIGSAALTATATDVTTAGFTAHVWDHNGADVGGTISWISNGS